MMEDESHVFYGMVVGNVPFESYLDRFSPMLYGTDEYGSIELVAIPDAPGPSGPTAGYKLTLMEPDEAPKNELELEDFYRHLAEVIQDDFKQNGGEVGPEDFLFA